MPGRFWPWKTIEMVVPRDLCMFEQLDTRGIPTHKLSRYVALQLDARGAFSDSRHWAVQHGNHVNVWSWDGALLAEFARSMGVGSDEVVCVPQGALAPATLNGAVWLGEPTLHGQEAQLWQSGQLLDSVFVSKAGVGDHWAQWLASHQPAVAGAQATPPMAWPDTSPLQKASYKDRAAKRNLLEPVLPTLPKLSSAMLPAVMGLATVALLCSFAWLRAQTHAFVAASEGAAVAEPQEATLRQRARSMQHDLRSSEQVALQYKSLIASPDSHDTVMAIAGLVTSQGVSLREFDLRNNTIQATVVSPNGNVALSDFLNAVDDVPLFRDAKFVDVAGGDGFKFAWRVNAPGLGLGAQTGDASGSAQTKGEPKIHARGLGFGADRRIDAGVG